MDAPKEVLIGRLAVERGLISEKELVQALEAQASGGAVPVGELLVQLNLIDRKQLSQLVALQRENLSAPSPYTEGKEVAADLLGKHAVEQGLITPGQLKETLREQGVMSQRGQPMRLGELLVDKGYLTFEQVEQLLGRQGKRLMRCKACGTQFNVHAEVKDAACNKCGGELAESASIPGARDAKSEGSYYAVAALAEDARAGDPAAQGQGVRYLDYQTRLVGTRPWWRRWWVHVALGGSVLAVLLVILLSPEPAPVKQPSQAPSAQPPRPMQGDLDAWRKSMDEAQVFAREGKWDEAIRIAERGKTLGFAQLDGETEKVLEQLRQHIVPTPPALSPIDPPAPTPRAPWPDDAAPASSREEEQTQTVGRQDAIPQGPVLRVHEGAERGDSKTWEGAVE